jgi:hypothetical protein
VAKNRRTASTNKSGVSMATIYHQLGIDHQAMVSDPLGRAICLTHGTPIAELAG